MEPNGRVPVIRRRVGPVAVGVLLLAGGGCGSEPPTAPGTTTLAYITETPEDNPGTLFVHDLQRNERQEVGAGSLRWVRDVSWSPNGKRLAVETEGGRQAVGIATTEGAVTWRSDEPEEEPGDDVADRAPTWSPDGEALAFVRSRATPGALEVDAGSRLHVVAADGTNERRVTEPGDRVEDLDPLAWSPAGGRLAFRRVTHRGDDPHRSVEIVHTVPVDGGPATRLTEGYEELRSLTWSPDGSRLAFVADGAVHLVAPDGTHRRHVEVEGPDPAHLAWAPDGQHLAFQGGAGSQLFLLAASGDGEPRPVTPPPDGVWDYAWSPDGEELAASAEHTGDASGLYRIDVASGQETLVAEPRDRVSEPAWSPDGQLLAFKATEEGAGVLGLDTASDVFLLRPDGSELHQLTSDGASHGPAFRR